MTNLITLTIPNDDHIALRAFGKALEEMALAHGAPLRVNPHVDAEKLRETMENAEPTHIIPEVDTTAQQVKPLAAHDVNAENFTEVTGAVPDNDLPIITVNPTCHALSNEELQDRGFDSTGTPWDERIHSASKALNADGTWRLRRKPKDMDEAEWSDYVSMIKADLQYPVECGGEGEEIDEPTSEEIDEWEKSKQPDYLPEPPVTHQNPVYMYQESRNVYALGRSDEEIAEYETKGYVRHTQEQYDAWEGPTVADEGDDFHTDTDVVTEQTVAGIPPLPVPPPVVIAPPVTEWDFPRLMTFLTERHGKIDVATVNTLLAQDGMLSVQELNAHPDKIGPFVARVKAHLGE